MMRSFSILFLLPLFVVSCFAIEAGETYTVLPDTDPPVIVDPQPPVDFQLPVEQQPPIIQYFGIPGLTADFADAPAIDIETYALEPITPADTSGLKAVLLSVLGDYESIVTDYRYQNASGNWQYLREVQPDYVWCCSAGVFALLLWCVFRMAGGLFCRK